MKIEIEEQYKMAIDARDKLNDNYYKWMSYYYLANAGIIVSITNLTKENNPLTIIFLSLVGVFISMLWNLSCKGYYYWSLSFIKIINKFESQIKIKHDDFVGVYSIFSKEIAEEKDSIFSINKPANISTPKLTLIFSFFSIIGWLILSFYEYYNNFYFECIYYKIILPLIFLFLILSIYYYIIPKYVKSRSENSHLSI